MSDKSTIAPFVGTKFNCSVISVPLSNYFSEDCIQQLAAIYSSLSSFRNRRIPVERCVVIGEDQVVGSPCHPPTRALCHKRKGLVNRDSILFEGGYVVSLEDLENLFRYWTCEMGWVGIDLRDGESAENLNNSAATLCKSVLNPDIERINRIVRWALETSASVAKTSPTTELTWAVCEKVFSLHLQTIEECVKAGLYVNATHGTYLQTPVTPDEFGVLKKGLFYREPNPEPLPGPVSSSIMCQPEPPHGFEAPAEPEIADQTEISSQEVVEGKEEMFHGGTISSKNPTEIGELLAFHRTENFLQHTKALTKPEFCGQLKVPMCGVRLPDDCRQFRFLVFIEEEDLKLKVLCHAFALRPIATQSLRPSVVLNQMGKIQGKKGVGVLIEVANKMGNSSNFFFDVEMLLAWSRKNKHGEWAEDLAARMEEMQTALREDPDVEPHWIGPHCECLVVFSTCGCETAQEPIPEPTEPLGGVQAEAGPEEPAPVAEEEEGPRPHEGAAISMDDWIRHAKGRMLEAVNDAKAALNTELERIRVRLDRAVRDVLDGLHKTIDADDYRKHYPEEVEEHTSFDENPENK